MFDIFRVGGREVLFVGIGDTFVITAVVEICMKKKIFYSANLFLFCIFANECLNAMEKVVFYSGLVVGILGIISNIPSILTFFNNEYKKKQKNCTTFVVRL